MRLLIFIVGRGIRGRENKDENCALSLWKKIVSILFPLIGFIVVLSRFYVVSLQCLFRGETTTIL